MSRLLPLLAADDLGFVASRYMPAFKVEVAFTSGYNTAAADRVWTDVSEYVELADLVGIDHGRQDERSTADANQVTLTLDNTDGRFTAGRSASPYYPNVKIGRPVRVSAMTVTGYTSVRFVGFIDEWPVEWDGTDAYAVAKVRATSRLARLGLSTKLRSVIENEILAHRPARYYTLGDASESVQASDSSGNNAQPLVVAGSGADVVFGSATGPGVDGLTAATFAEGKYLTTPAPSAAQPRAIHVDVKLDALPPSVINLVNVDTTLPAAPVLLRVSTSGALLARFDADQITGPTLSVGQTYGVTFVFSGTPGDAELFVDGVSVGTHPTLAVPYDAENEMRVGQGLTGVLAHVAYFDTSSATIDDAAAAAMSGSVDGFEGDRTDERLVRVLGWAGVAASEITADTGSETMTYQVTSGQSVVDVVRECESTESGVLFDGRDGNVVFHNRARRYLATPAATLDMSAQHVGADYAPKLDRSTLANSAEVDNPTTGETARYTDTASIDEYGVASTSAKCVATTSDPLLQKAAWLVYSYAEPRPRVPSLTVDVLAHVGATPSAEDLLALGVGDLIEVVNQPTQADATTAQYFVEGYSEAIGPESYSITFNLSPSHPSLSTFVLDDADRGELDSTYVLAL